MDYVFDACAVIIILHEISREMIQKAGAFSVLWLK